MDVATASQHLKECRQRLESHPLLRCRATKGKDIACEGEVERGSSLELSLTHGHDRFVVHLPCEGV